MSLELVGWNSIFEFYFDELKKPDLVPARISSEDKGSYMLMTDQGELRGKISGSYRYSAKNRVDFPVVGDWAAVEIYSSDSVAIIHELLPRRTIMSRKVSGDSIEEQPLVANIDYAFIVSGLDGDFNLRRIERYLTLAWDSNAKPVIILNKVDLIKDEGELNRIREQIDTIALGVPVHFISPISNNGMVELNTYFNNNQTIALLGSSGVGKSTITNRLLGEEYQKTASTRISDSKGRHTTTRRQLFLLPNGGLLVDTPGMRELQLWVDEKGLDSSFSDIEALAENCRFTDCSHNQEPGCAVQEAIAQNRLDIERFHNYQKLQKEVRYLSKKQEETSWDSRLEDRKFGKYRHSVLKQRKQMNTKK
ncbi:MAG: ribosome small subunit-dependent GTPase A [Gammaproteobacteria bacterium]|jgi:ribosome biogenesis GTPase